MSLKSKVPFPALGPERRSALADQLVPAQIPRSTCTSPEGCTSLEELGAQAVHGRADAAQHLIRLLIEEDPHAIQAVVRYPGPQFLERVLEWLALGVWAGKYLAFPSDVSEPQARTRLRRLFLPRPSGSSPYGQQVLCAGLHDPRAKVRAKAAQVLGLLGEPAVGADLEAALHDSTNMVRIQAAKALGRLQLLHTAPALVEVLTLHEETLASQVPLALHQLGRGAIPALLKGAHSPDPWVRWHVFRILEELHAVRGESALVEGLADSDHAVAWMAARALASPSRQTIAAILRLLMRAPCTPWLCETAAYVLRRQRYAPLKAILAPVLHSLHSGEYRITVPQTAARALAYLETAHT